ncbi:MAG TPA: hypothetical protein VJB63_02775 [Patescibacteria group bacterium]|nr:hypothetical protein [Patescibacteria group bacterium]
MASIIIMVINTQTSTKFQQSFTALYTAESGVENALLRLLRNPNYIGEIVPIDTGNATITVTDIGGGQKQIVSVGKSYTILRTLQIVVSYIDNILTVVSWKEI